MAQAVKILNTLATDDELRRLAADREARIKLDEMYRRLELREAKEAAEKEGRERGRQEGREEGRERGREEGRDVERRRLLDEALASVRAGEASSAVVARMFDLDVAEVERLLSVGPAR